MHSDFGSSGTTGGTARSSARRTNTEMQRRSPRMKTAPQNPRRARRRRGQSKERVRLPVPGTPVWDEHGWPSQASLLLHAVGQECPTHIPTSSYLYPQKFFEDESGNHRKNEKQPDPVHLVSENFNVALGIVDCDGLYRAILRYRRFCRTQHSFPKVSAQAHGRHPCQL